MYGAYIVLVTFQTQHLHPYVTLKSPSIPFKPHFFPPPKSSKIPQIGLHIVSEVYNGFHHVGDGQNGAGRWSWDAPWFSGKLQVVIPEAPTEFIGSTQTKLNKICLRKNKQLNNLLWKKWSIN